MSIRLIHILFALFLWGSVDAHQEFTLPKYKQYTLREGLSQMQVTAMMQDSRGYIWVGTKAGLNCFNGDKIVNYTSEKNPELIDDYIIDIKEDSFGKIWASTTSGIFAIDGAAIKYFYMPDWSSTKLTTDNEGRIWYMSINNTEDKYHFGYYLNGNFVSLDDKLSKLSFSIIYDIMYVKNEDKILISISSNLYQYLDSEVREVYKNSNDIAFIPNAQGKCFFADSDSIKNFNLNSYSNGKIEVVASIKDGSYLFKPKLKKPLFYTGNSLPFNTVGLTLDKVIYDFTEGLQTSKVLYDRDEQLWVGSEVGFYQLFDNGFSTFTKDFLPQVWAITEDRKGNIWFSSFLFGLSKIENGQLFKYPELTKKQAAYFYFHPSVDKRGRIFFPNGYGMLKVDGNSFQQNSEILYMTTFYDSDKDLLWAGSKEHVVAFGPSGEKRYIVDKSKGLDVGKLVLVINKDDSGFYWFGGRKGIAKYNWDTKELKNYKLGHNQSVVSICNDFKGRSWFGSDKGLFWYNSTSDSIVKLQCEELSDAVNLVTTIDSTWLIASQPYGIYLMDLQEYYRSGKIELNLFNEKNGFMGVEPGQDGAFTDSKGNIWMSTSTEVVKLDPRKLKIDKNSFNLRVNRVNGKPLPFSSGNIELQRNQNSAILTFESICFNRPNPVQYSWKLAADTVWSPWQEEDYAVIDGLEDGNTKILVRSRVKGLPLKIPPQISVNFKVRIAIYRQEWFFPTLFLFISLIGISLLVSALLKMKRIQREAKMFQIQAIQSQMNPHFIFNVLASLQSMILKANIARANDYLVKLADLIRGFLEASAGTGIMKNPESNEGQVSIVAELALLKEYIEFQQVINPGRFDYSVHIDDNIDPEIELIPPLLIQPFIENSIRHGLLPSTNKGLLFLSFQKAKDVLIIEIQDNGVGIEKSQQMLEKSPMRYISRGTELTVNRIKLLNQLGFKIEIETYSTSETTRVFIKLHK